jgi:hypothetical protein
VLKQRFEVFVQPFGTTLGIKSQSVDQTRRMFHPSARRTCVNQHRDQIAAGAGSNAIKTIEKTDRSGFTIGADRDPTPT